MSAATTSPFLPPSTVASQPSTAASAATNYLSLHPKPSPLTSLSLSLSAACPRFPNSAFSERPQPRIKPSNPNKPPFSLHGLVNAVNGFTHHFSNFIFQNPIFYKPLAAGDKSHRLWPLLNICPPAMAKEDNKPQGWDSHGMHANSLFRLNQLSRLKKYKISDIKFINPRTRATVADAEESFGDLLVLRRGGVYTKQQLMESLNSISSTQLFDKIDFDVKTNPDGSVDINIPYKEKFFPPKTKFRCVAFGSIPEEEPIDADADLTEKELVEFNSKILRRERERIESGRACMLGDDVAEEIEWMLVKRTSLSASLHRKIMKKIEKWYHDRKYCGAWVVRTSFPELPGAEITYEVVEGDVDKIQVKFVDKLGNICEGNTNLDLIHRVLPKELAVGKALNKKVIDEACRNLDALGLFSNMEIDSKTDEKNGAISLDIILQEEPHKWSELSTEWKIVPSRNRRGPTLASLIPGAKISFGHNNFKGLNRTFRGELNLSNLFDPQDDIGFNFEYKHPYIDGMDDPRNRTFQTTCFRSMKLSPVFRGGPGVDGSTIWVDRFGVKANISENYTRQSKFTYGIVLEDIKTRGEGGDVVSRGDMVFVNGRYVADGPPTTLSGTGRDLMAFLQANLTRDNTRFVNGLIVGERDVFQVDQGFGIGGLFNRHKVSATRFIPLKQVEEGEGKAAPPVLVVNGVYGGCVGDLPNHEAFIIGGPHSVRGYAMGEIGASRHKLEVGAEIRVAVPVMKTKTTYAYAFAEHGNDLGSSVGVKGNPTKAYRRRGHGSSYGAGIKFRHMRAEYAVDHNTATGAFFFHFGERF